MNIARSLNVSSLQMFGIGGVAQYVFTKDVKNSGATFLSVNFAWGLGVMFGVYWSAGVSGTRFFVSNSIFRLSLELLDTVFNIADNPRDLYYK